MRARRTSIITVITAVVLSVVAGAADAAHGDHVVIAEVQVGGTSARDEFIELYNPTSAAIPIEGWRLSRRTASGKESNLVTSFPALVVPTHGSVLIAHPDGTFAAGADQRYTTQDALAQDNAIVLYGPASSGGSARPIVDLVGWGAASSREGVAAPNPPASQSIERKPGGANGNAQDTGDNVSDFIVQPQPSPQAASSAARPVVDTTGGGGSSSGSGASGAPNPDVGSGASGGTGGSSGGSTTSGSSGNATTSGSTGAGGANATTGASTAAETDAARTTSDGARTATGGTTVSAPLVEPSVPSRPPAVTHVRINEFVVDPADGDEWIELVNVGPNAVSLVDWTVEDGAETRTLLAGALGVGDHRFFVIRKPKGVLNNTGDRIVLRDPHGSVVDAVTYGDWDDGKRDDNAPTATDPAAVARVVDGQDTNTDRTDFVRTEVPTPGQPNVIAAVPETDIRPSVDGPRSAAPSIVVNELLPDPFGDGAREEFIELANVGSAGVDLTSWRFRDELGMEYVIRGDGGPTVIAPGAVLAFPRSRTSIALNNSGGEIVRLFRPDGDRAVSVAEYRGTAPVGASWSRDGNGRWSWTTQSTPGTTNVLRPPNRPPDAVIDGPSDAMVGAVIALDGSDSVDPDRDGITYAWDFGDPSTDTDHGSDVMGRYVYERPGTYVVRLAVTDTHGAVATAAHRITIRAPAAPSGGAGALEEAPRAPPPTTIGPTTLRFSELLPNPVGRDEDEWVELENTGDAPIALRGWMVVSATVPGERAHARERQGALPPDTNVAPHSLVVIPRAALHLALRNDGATLVLRSPDGAVVDRLTYAEPAAEGESFIRTTDGSWAWTTIPTPGAPNAVTSRAEDEDEDDAAVGGRESEPRDRRKPKGRPVTVASLAELRGEELGTTVVARGVVTAPPRTVGKQLFYMSDDRGGVQVFFGQREPSPLAIGERVEVTGELREVGGELRIGVARVVDVRAIGRTSPPDPAPLRIREAGADRLGALVVVEGEVVERRGRTVAIDDGSEELRIALPSNDAADVVGAGDTVRVVGVLSRTRSGFRILPRSSADVTLVARATPAAGAASIPPPAVPPELELALLGGGSGALVVASLWRRRRLLNLAYSGARAAIAALFRRFG